MGNILKGIWKRSGATKDTLECHGNFNWLHPNREVPNTKETKLDKITKVLN